MPLFSIMLLLFLIPAVSMNLNFIPFSIISSSIASLVVPGISETIALSSFNIAFNNVDFPTLGSPAIAIGIPFLSTLPTEKEFL